MKRLSIRVLSFIIVLAMSVGLFAGFASATTVEWPGTPTGYTSASDVSYVKDGSYIANWGARGEACTFLPTYAQSYYTGSYTFATLSAKAGGTSQGNATSSALYAALKSMMKAKHTHETSYNETRDLYCDTDCVNGNYSYISSFYSGMKLNGSWGTGWNREHTWPNSKGNDNQDNDIMMLRPTSNEENSDRGNTAYGESSGYYDPNKESNGALNLHGDCARIVLYCYVRWENQSYMWGQSGVMENLNVLLKWMEEDPVDTWEMGRNDSVQSITGVRNVFVDYPEFAWLLFGRDVPDGYVTPSGSMGGSETCNHVWNAGAVTTAATCTQSGVMTYTCTLCGRTKTESIPAAGHNFVNGVCTVCGASQGAVYSLANTLNTGDEVILYNAGNSKAIPATMKGSYYLDSVEIAAVNGVISNPDASIVWKVTKNTDGTYTFKNGSDTLSINWDTESSKTSLSLDGRNPKIAADVCSAGNNSFYLRSATQTGNYGNIYLEWYANYTEFSAYDTTASRLTEKDFGFQFYVKGGAIAPTEPTTAPQPTTAPTAPVEGDFALASSIKGGDQVVIYNPGHGMAIKDENDNHWYLVPQAITPSNNTIAAPDASLVWTVVDNGNGTYSFVNGSDKIVCWLSGNYFELTNDPTHDGADGSWKVDFAGDLAYIKHATFSNNYGPAYIECYYNANKDKTNVSGYSTSDPTAKSADFGWQFYVKGGSVSPTTAPTEPTTAPTQPTTPTTPSQTYYTITWYVDGQAYREQCAKGEIPVFSGSTDKPADEQYTYTFAGWSPIPVPAYSDATYIATYTKEPIRPEGTYLITWVVDGNITTLRYEAGVMPTYPGSTDKPDDENYVYCFTGWSPAVEIVTKNATYTAQYNRIALHKVEDFLDVPEEMWCYDEVHRAAQLGLFNGMSYLHFEPNGDVSRAMIVTVLYRMEGQPEVKMSRTFSDVPSDRWFSDAVLWAYENGIAKGVSTNLFAPNAPVTREQLAAFLYRYAEWKGYDVSGRGRMSPFADRNKISDYAADALSWAVGSDMLRGMDVNGKLCLAPQGTATRAQAASIMVRFFNAFVK